LVLGLELLLEVVEGVALQALGQALELLELLVEAGADGLTGRGGRVGPGDAEPGEEHGGPCQATDGAPHDQAPPRKKTTKPMRARASTKAMPRNMVVRTMPAASG